MKPGLRTLGPSSLKLSHSQTIKPTLRGKLLELTNLHTPEEERGNGNASKLIQLVCDEADQERKALMLMPDNMSLATFYNKFGFDFIQTDPAIMVRMPK